MEKKSLHIIEVLSAMETYLKRNDHNFHNSLDMAYCDNCHSISAVGGDYRRHMGNDCLGAHYETVESPELCTLCQEQGNFIKFSLNDFGTLKEFSPETLIKGIENGLEQMNFPSLYNKGLPKIVRKWGKLSKKEKIAEFSKLYGLQEDLSKAIKKREIAGKTASNLEAALAV